MKNRPLLIGALLMLGVVCLAEAGQVEEKAQSQPGPAPYAGELITISVLPTWHLGLYDRHRDREVRALVPKGESIGNWTEMISQQTWFRVRGASVERVMEALMESAVRSCPNHESKKLFFAQEHGYEFGLMLQFCPLSRGKGGITTYKVIQGRESLYIVHRPKRVPVFPPTSRPM